MLYLSLKDQLDNAFWIFQRPKKNKNKNKKSCYPTSLTSLHRVQKKKKRKRKEKQKTTPSCSIYFSVDVDTQKGVLLFVLRWLRSSNSSKNDCGFFFAIRSVFVPCVSSDSKSGWSGLGGVNDFLFVSIWIFRCLSLGNIGEGEGVWRSCSKIRKLARGFFILQAGSAGIKNARRDLALRNWSSWLFGNWWLEKGAGPQMTWGSGQSIIAVFWNWTVKMWVQLLENEFVTL